MKVIIGSKNPTKINACVAVFEGDEVIGADVPSQVSAQPFSDEETRKGAINRAMASAEQSASGIGIGLEGGVMLLMDTLYLCNWGALVTSEGKVFTASGARIVLPQSFLKEINAGKELADIMAVYAKKENVRSKEGAVGIFTNDLIDRSEMFTHVVKLLRGQWEYDKKGVQH